MPKVVTTLEDAADLFDQMQDQGVTSADVADFYVEPPGARPDPALPASASVRERITRHLVRRRKSAEKVFLTGQKGAGKTMTLARIVSDRAITEHFAPLVVRATHHIPAGAADIRLLLVVLIAQVSKFIEERRLDERVDLGGLKIGGPIGKVLSGWTKLFADTGAPAAPETLQNAKTRVSVQFLELSEEIVRDPQRRAQVLADPRYSVTELHRVASALIEFAQQALELRVDGPQYLLLVIDDLDKYAVPAEVKSIFYDGMEALRSLPCPAVLTYPYFLNFTDSFVLREDSAYAIHNVKVAERVNQPPTLLPLERRALLEPARAFFNGVYDKLADRSLVLDQAVIDRAALLSAGIPREFLRLLSAGFELCIDHQKPRLDLPTLNVARIGLQQTMARTANEPWRQAGLKLVQSRGDLQGLSEMLDTVHVVEYVNSALWYGVHPALEDTVEAWIRQDRNLLMAKGTGAAAVERELEETWLKAATERPRTAD